MVLCIHFMYFFFTWSNSSEQHKNYLIHVSKDDTNAISVCARRETEPLAVLRSGDYLSYKPRTARRWTDYTCTGDFNALQILHNRWQTYRTSWSVYVWQCNTVTGQHIKNLVKLIWCYDVHNGIVIVEWEVFCEQFFSKRVYHAKDRHLKAASNESLSRCLMTHFAIYCYNMLPGALIDKWSYWQSCGSVLM